MTDGIIKGTGNSRYLKSVANALALYPTHESLMEALASGTFPIDLNGINPAGWNTVGDKLDKATLLTDALCTALGLSTTATPTQAMEKLRQLVNTAQSTANGKGFVSSGSYAGSGTSSKSLSFSFVPKFMVIVSNKRRHQDNWLGTYGILSYGGLGAYMTINPNASANLGISVSVSGNTMSWSSYDAITSLNESNVTYYYSCFG